VEHGAQRHGGDGGPVSEKPDAVLVRDVEVPMRDGVVLRGDLWRPADGLVPTVVFRTPYDRRALNSDALRVSHCLERGFGAFVQDTRGRFGSDGDWQPLMWETEGPDGYDTVEWVAAQPWSDGRVFLAGASFLGIAQWLTAMEQPPHLTAIAPGFTTSWELEQLETGGIARLDHVTTWFVFMLADFLSRRAATGDADALARLQALLPLAQDPTPALVADPPGAVPALQVPDAPMQLADLLHGTPTVPGYDYDRVQVPTLSVAGWYDVFLGGTIRSFQQMVSRGPGHQLVIGPWTHASALGHIQGQLNLGLGAAGAGAKLPDQHLDFFSGAAEGGVRWFLLGADTWQQSPTWPPPGTVEKVLHLGPGTLLDEPDDSGTTWRHDPADPVPTLGGRTLNLGRLSTGPLDQRPLMARDDVRTFVTAPLTSPLTLAGAVRVELDLVSTAAETDVTAKLVVVRTDGSVIPVAQGSRRTGPGVVQVDLAHTGVWLAPGERLGLLLASTDFPHLERHPEPADQVVRHGSSRLVVEVLP
jgi:putative CocE/NonD family hydrolase